MTTPRRPKTKADRLRKADEMTDQEAADFYYAHRDEPDDAATSVDLEAPRRLSRVVSVRFDPEEAVVIEQRAKPLDLPCPLTSAKPRWGVRPYRCRIG